MLRSDRSAHRTITFHPTCITYPRNHNSGSGMRLLLTFSLAVDPTMALTVHASRGYIQPFACIWLAGSFTEAFRPYVMPSWASPDMPGNYICFHWMIMKAVMLKPPPSCNFSTHWDVQPQQRFLSCRVRHGVLLSFCYVALTEPKLQEKRKAYKNHVCARWAQSIFIYENSFYKRNFHKGLRKGFKTAFEIHGCAEQSSANFTIFLPRCFVLPLVCAFIAALVDKRFNRKLLLQYFSRIKG